MTPIWIRALSAILRPRDYVKRKCLIDGLPMERDAIGNYKCANGHIFVVGGNGKADAATEATRGSFHGDL